MDDSLWIAPNKSLLTQILTIANFFYNFAIIKVNLTKSILATNTISEDKMITFNREILKAIDNSQSFKYLEAWFSITGKPITTQKTILTEVLYCVTNLQKFFITEKQA